LVFVQFATLTGLFLEQLSTTLILFISLCLIFTPYILSHNRFFDKLLGPINKRLAKLFYRKVKVEDTEPDREFSNHIVLFGLGRMGFGVLEGLLRSKLVKASDIIVIDDDPEGVNKAMKLGVFGICGQADNPEIIERTNLNSARAIVISIPYYDVNEVILKHVDIRKIPIFMRAYFVQEAVDYYKRGIKYVVVPQVMATNQLLKEIYNNLNNVKESTMFNDILIDIMKKYSKEETFLQRNHRYSN